MYRQSYPQPQIATNINNQMPANMSSQMGGYDFRSPSIHYKAPPAMEGMSSNFHQPPPHQLYYENQTVSGPSPLDQNPYMNMMQVQNMDPGYDMQRYYWRQMQPKHLEGYSMPPPPVHSASQYVPPPNVVQRIAGIIKSQLPSLQAVMVQVSSIYNTRVQTSRRQYSPSRSRSKQRHRKGSDSSHDWLCRKCSFSNYDWRENCKKCKQLRPSRNFVPGPEDWKCPKCGNINYARRMECNRCKRPKSEND